MRCGTGGGADAIPSTIGPRRSRWCWLVTFMGSLSGGVFWAAMFFVTARHYGFSPERNLMLAAVMGAVYAVAAAGAGRLVRRLSSLSSPRAVLVAALAAWTIAALIPLAAPRAEAVIWAAAVLGAVASAVTWPIVESYLAAGRHGAEMRAADRLVQRHLDAGDGDGAAADADRQPGRHAGDAGAVGGRQRRGAARDVRAAQRARARTSPRRRRRRSGANTAPWCARRRGCFR